jgi:ribosomal protein S18 acetylase RimI-like enzyme
MSDPTVLYTLRPSHPADMDFLFALHRSTMRAYVERIWGWDDDAQKARFAEYYPTAERRIVVVDGVDVGALAIDYRPDAIFVVNIEILPAFQGQGLGAQVLTDIIIRAQDDGRTVELQVLKVNPARRLYERLGFQVTGETETHYLMRRPLEG